jgi:hypothetical protein
LNITLVIVKKKVPIAEGVVIAVLNTEVVMVDIWRHNDPETATVHYLPLSDMKWNEFSQTGFVFAPPKQNLQ